MIIKSIDDISSEADYVDGGSAFFQEMSPSWDSVRNQVCKYEVQQEYYEPDNASLQLFLSGKKGEAAACLTDSLKGDDDLYEELKKRHVEFLRCHPIVYPASSYIRWELESYEVTAQKGERIFCLNYDQIGEFIGEYASKDFMIFDARSLHIHDYDHEGRIVGGWVTRDPSHVQSALAIFARIKAEAAPFSLFR